MIQGGEIMYISKIELRNFRIFDEVGITVYVQKAINAIISENNSGKSAIVDALRIAFSTVPYAKMGNLYNVVFRQIHV